MDPAQSECLAAVADGEQTEGCVMDTSIGVRHSIQTPQNHTRRASGLVQIAEYLIERFAGALHDSTGSKIC